MKPFNDTFLKACRSQPTSYTPVWYMRQAGRYQPEYQKIRERYSLFEITHHPEVCAQVTRLPVEQLGVDAAILFADIMTPLQATGINVEIKPGVGPVIDPPIRTSQDVNRLRALEPESDVSFTIETVNLLTEQLHVPLIGFAGAPFTLASYLLEGGPSKNYHQTKAFMYTNPEGWQVLMNKLAAMTTAYLKAQIAAGASAVQIFDSWVGALNEVDYQAYIAPVMQRIVTEVKQAYDVPLIYFGVGASHLLDAWGELDVDVIGLDWRTSLREARAQGNGQALQGNLDPALLLAPWSVIEKNVKRILDEGLVEPGYIFNLGHGVFPQVEPETLKKLTDLVHHYSAR